MSKPFVQCREVGQPTSAPCAAILYGHDAAVLSSIDLVLAIADVSNLSAHAIRMGNNLAAHSSVQPDPGIPFGSQCPFPGYAPPQQAFVTGCKSIAYSIMVPQAGVASQVTPEKPSGQLQLNPVRTPVSTGFTSVSVQMPKLWQGSCWHCLSGHITTVLLEVWLCQIKAGAHNRPKSAAGAGVGAAE